MKKTILFIAFLFFVTIAFAQKSRFEFGIESGVNVSKIQKYGWIYGPVPLKSPTWQTGIQGALSLRYRISEHWRLKTELSYVQKGWRGQRFSWGSICRVGYTDDELKVLHNKYLQDISTPKITEISYLSIPLLAEYSFCAQKLYAQFGGYWSYQANYSLANQYDYGTSLGIGTRLKLTKGLKLSFDARYSQGFSNIFQDPETIYLGNGQTYTYDSVEWGKGNQTLAINIGLVFTRH